MAIESNQASSVVLHDHVKCMLKRNRGDVLSLESAFGWSAFPSGVIKS